MQCDVCACAFEPVSSAWPDRCGTCIAAELELSLIRPLLGTGERKPARHAEPVAVEPEVIDNGQTRAA